MALMGEEVALMWRMYGQGPYFSWPIVGHTFRQGEGIESLDHIWPSLIITASNPVLDLLSGVNQRGQIFCCAVVCSVKLSDEQELLSSYCHMCLYMHATGYSWHSWLNDIVLVYGLEFWLLFSVTIRLSTKTMWHVAHETQTWLVTLLILLLVWLARCIPRGFNGNFLSLGKQTRCIATFLFVNFGHIC